ncbi:DUF1080 domain-containing protein [Lentisphaera marina]|uniref:3-keto-disaccharide hydrolase n=1 Tax=Lentisphaera marina TaxID=1111041 RepID=UPI0023664051|nr:DUF1080 domain-containing protein [Lentisphaera marina]MDD7984639.1 DUF1080 domain-containing protein [Lentisphaera marina]
MNLKNTGSILCLLASSFAWSNNVSGLEGEWSHYSPSNFEQEWEVKENGFNSRRLSKKSQKVFSVKEDVFTVESEYQSIGKFLCTKKSYTDFIFEAEVMTNNLRSGAFVAYHAQFLDKKWKGKGRTYKSLYGFTYGFGNWPQTTGEAEIRYTGSKSLIADHKEVEFQTNKWHKVKIVVKDNTIQHWFDSVLVAELNDVRETLKSQKLDKSEDPMKGPIVLGMPGHPKGQKDLITVKWKNVRVKEL